MEPAGVLAFCPTCAKEYTFFGDTDVLDPRSSLPSAQLRAPLARGRSASDGRWARPCFACSFRTSRWDALWIPAFLLVVMSFPLLWMIWSNLIGPLVFLSPVALALGRRARRVLGRGAHGPDVAPQAE